MSENRLYSIIKLKQNRRNMDGTPIVIAIIVVVLILWIIAKGFRVIPQSERGVVFTLGKYAGMRNAGPQLIVPFFQTIRNVDVRSTPIDVPKQEVITKDNVTVNVDAMV